MSDPVHVSARDEGAVRIVTMSSPGGVNVFTDDSLADLEDALTKADADDAIRVVVLRSGERSFAAGADIDAFPEPPTDPTSFVSRLLHGNSAPERLQKPVIAAVDGAVVAGGFELALACDWIVASPSVTFSLPEARFGLVAGYAAARLPQLVGTHWTRRLLMTGEALSASEAAAIGLPVTVADEPLQGALEMADQMCHSAPQAVRIIKSRSVAQAQAVDPGFTVGLAAYAQLWNLPDTRDALHAWRNGQDVEFRPLSDPWAEID